MASQDTTKRGAVLSAFTEVAEVIDSLTSAYVLV